MYTNDISGQQSFGTCFTQSNQQDNVVKFLLKLRNNNIQNLKNALRKLGEKTNGNKEQLLLRLAQKLATPEGQRKVQASFRPEIYSQLYEIPLNQDYFMLAQQNNFFNQYQPFIQQNNVINQQTMISNCQVNQFPNPINQVNCQQISEQKFVNPNALLTQNKFPLNGQPQQQFQSNQQNQEKAGELQKNVGSMEKEVINILDSDNENERQPQVHFQQNLTTDFHRISFQQITENQNYPCILDEPSLGQRSDIYCYCDNYNSKYYQNTNQQQVQTGEQCQQCGKHTHTNCLEKNIEMRKSQQKYICIQCQFMSIDPLALPVATILRPFKVPKLTSIQVKQRYHDPKFCKEVLIREQIYLELNRFMNAKDNQLLRVQVRCLRIDGQGFEHCWPKFGGMSINGHQHQDFKIPDPPNDQKKRKDDIFDITQYLKKGKNKFEIYQEQKNHEGYFNHPTQVCAIFLVRVIQPYDVINYVKQNQIEDQLKSVQRAFNFFSKKEEPEQEIEEIDFQQETEKIKINLLCPITYTPIKTPARGDLCTHLQCFDLECYINLNAKHKRWKCPLCNKRAFTTVIDSYFQLILNLMLRLKETNNVIKDKIEIDHKLSLIAFNEDGKSQTKFDIQKDNESRYKYEISNDETLGESTAASMNGGKEELLQSEIRKLNQQDAGSEQSNPNKKGKKPEQDQELNPICLSDNEL